MPTVGHIVSVMHVCAYNVTSMTTHYETFFTAHSKSRFQNCTYHLCVYLEEACQVEACTGVCFVPVLEVPSRLGVVLPVVLLVLEADHEVLPSQVDPSVNTKYHTWATCFQKSNIRTYPYWAVLKTVGLIQLHFTIRHHTPISYPVSWSTHSWLQSSSFTLICCKRKKSQM